MKALKISRLCFIVALLLGLLLAWSTATPQLISGKQISGAECGCDDVHSTTCPALPDKECNEYCYRCDETGDGNCTNKATHCGCADPYDDCVNWLWHNSCN